MNRFQSHAILACTLAAALSTVGCAGMSHNEKATAVGATVGGVAGAALTNGSPVGAVGGAVIGGVVGSHVEKRHND